MFFDKDYFESLLAEIREIRLYKRTYELNQLEEFAKW